MTQSWWYRKWNGCPMEKCCAQSVRTGITLLLYIVVDIIATKDRWKWEGLFYFLDCLLLMRCSDPLCHFFNSRRKGWVMFDKFSITLAKYLTIPIRRCSSGLLSGTRSLLFASIFSWSISTPLAPRMWTRNLIFGPLKTYFSLWSVRPLVGASNHCFYRFLLSSATL